MTEPASVVRTIFLNSRGLRAGWRLLIFIGLFIGLGLIGYVAGPQVLPEAHLTAQNPDENGR